MPIQEGRFMSTPAHTALSIEQFLTKRAWSLWPTLNIYPTLPQVTLFLFPPMKNVPKGKHFADVEEVKQTMAESLKGITIDKFWTVQKQNLFWAVETCLNRCVASNGEYFEGDLSLNM